VLSPFPADSFGIHTCGSFFIHEFGNGRVLLAFLHGTVTLDPE
jgi:hypothetical protein